MVKNYNEVLAEEYLRELLEHDPRFKGISLTEETRDDILAKALNNIRPFYITCKKGEVFGKYQAQDFQNKTDMILEIAKAIEWISARMQKP